MELIGHATPGLGRHRGAQVAAITLLTAIASLPAMAGGYGHGTSAAVIVSPSAIVAAIDSKEVYREYLNDGTATTEDRIACKIRQTGPYYIWVAGIARASNGFDALREARSFYRESDSLDQFATHLMDGLPPLLTPILEAIRAANPTAFDQAYKGQDVVQFTLLGVEGSEPRAIVVMFTAAQTATGKLAIYAHQSSCPGECGVTNKVYLLGLHQEAEQFLQANPEAGGVASAHNALQLVELEQRSHPDVVGGPSTVIRVTGGGIAVEQPGTCVDDAEWHRLESRLGETISAVSDVSVHEDIAQHSRRGTQLRSGSLHADVRVLEGKEEYSWTSQYGKAETRVSRLPEPWCGGELSTMLRATREEIAQAQGTLALVTLPAQEPEVVVTFHSTAAERHWQLVMGSRTYPVAFEGRAWFSQATGQLVRIHWEATDLQLSASAGITRIEWDESFLNSDIAGHTYLTPNKATYRVSYSWKTERTDWTETTFSDFRRFGATEKVEFELTALR